MTMKSRIKIAIVIFLLFIPRPSCSAPSGAFLNINFCYDRFIIWNMEKFDLIVIGGSAAATSAGIYAARRGLRFKIISKDFGGEVATSGEIGNWPGDGMTDGIALADKFKKHLEYYKVNIEEGIEVEKITKQEDDTFCISTRKGTATGMAVKKMPDSRGSALKCDYIARAIIVATGVHPRELNISGEKEFRNKGVSYCSTCDMPLFMGKTVAIIGGGNSALESGLMAIDIAKKASAQEGFWRSKAHPRHAIRHICRLRY